MRKPAGSRYAPPNSTHDDAALLALEAAFLQSSSCAASTRRRRGAKPVTRESVYTSSCGALARLAARPKATFNASDEGETDGSDSEEYDVKKNVSSLSQWHGKSIDTSVGRQQGSGQQVHGLSHGERPLAGQHPSPSSVRNVLLVIEDFREAMHEISADDFDAFAFHPSYPFSPDAAFPSPALTRCFDAGPTRDPPLADPAQGAPHLAPAAHAAHAAQRPVAGEGELLGLFAGMSNCLEPIGDFDECFSASAAVGSWIEPPTRE